jgi:hypothetical protein
MDSQPTKTPEENGREQITMKVWRETYLRLWEIKKGTGLPIVKLIDNGVKLLEKHEAGNEEWNGRHSKH